MQAEDSVQKMTEQNFELQSKSERSLFSVYYIER